MNKLIPLFAAGIFTGLSANATLIYSSSLQSPPLTAGNLVGQDNWAAHSGAGAIAVQTGATGATLAHGSGSREDVYQPLTAIGVGQTYYYGFDLVVTGSGAPTAVYFAHFKDALVGSDFTTRAHIAPPTSGGDFTFGLSAANSGPDVTIAAAHSYGVTYRVVGSYTQGTNLTQLWIDPTSEASPSVSFTDPAAHPTAAFAFRQSAGNTTQLVSNLAVGTAFSDVVPAAVPEAGTAGLLALGLLLLRRRR